MGGVTGEATKMHYGLTGAVTEHSEVGISSDAVIEIRG